MIEHNKSEVFHFSRATKNFDLSPLDLRSLEGSILWLKDKWRYLGFIFDRKLLFQYHIHFYSNKALSIIKSMKMLGNSTRRLLPLYKWLLYRMCIMPIALYDFQLLLELKMENSNYSQFFSYFYFLFLLFLFWDLGLENSMTSHVTYHSHKITWYDERSRKI